MLLCWLCFVNPTLQHCYKENIRSDDHHASLMLLCWLCFVSPSLQHCYKENVWLLACISLMLLCFVSPSLQYCYKENIRRSSCISHVVVFCKPILATLLQRKRLIAIVASRNVAISRLGRVWHENRRHIKWQCNGPFRVEFGESKRPNLCFSCYRVFLSTFSCVFYPRRESATSRHNADCSHASLSCWCVL